MVNFELKFKSVLKKSCVQMEKRHTNFRTHAALDAVSTILDSLVTHADENYAFLAEYHNTPTFEIAPPKTQQLIGDTPNTTNNNSVNELSNETIISGPPPNSWSSWSGWTECSLSCGSGRQSRMRQCQITGARELDCTGLTVDIRECNTFSCPSEPQVYFVLNFFQ